MEFQIQIACQNHNFTTFTDTIRISQDSYRRQELRRIAATTTAHTKLDAMFLSANSIEFAVCHL
jgi:hypothetical protein